MSRAERVLWLVTEMHRLDVERERWDECPWLLGWIESCVRPDNGRSDMQARAEVQEAFEALGRFQRERAEAGLTQRELVEAAGLKFGREDPVTGEPLPDGVAGFPAGGRR